MLVYTLARGCPEADWVLAPDMECRHDIYLGCGYNSGPQGCEVDTVFQYHTRGLVRWVGGEDCGDMGAIKPEGQASLEPPKSPGYACTGYCLLAVGYVESGLVSIYEYAAGNELLCRHG